MQKVIIDCDPGMDDSVALLKALGSRSVNVLAIASSHGNVPVELATTNALKITELLDANIPVLAGASRALNGSNSPDPFSHGDDGQAENYLPAPRREAEPVDASKRLAELICENWGEIEYIVTGPMTNLAQVIRSYPDVAEGVKGVTAISGSFGLNFESWANATGDNPVSEWNVYVDPEAARTVYESTIPLKAIGLDVATHFEVDFTQEQIERLNASSNPSAQFLAQSISFVTGRGYGAYCAVIDAIAIAAVEKPELLTYETARVGIALNDSLTRGMTVVDRRHHHSWTELPEIQIAIAANHEVILADIVDAFTS